VLRISTRFLRASARGEAYARQRFQALLGQGGARDDSRGSPRLVAHEILASLFALPVAAALLGVLTPLDADVRLIPKTLARQWKTEDGPKREIREIRTS
jgi:hypothetical protein